MREAPAGGTSDHASLLRNARCVSGSGVEPGAREEADGFVQDRLQVVIRRLEDSSK